MSSLVHAWFTLILNATARSVGAPLPRLARLSLLSQLQSSNGKTDAFEKFWKPTEMLWFEKTSQTTPFSENNSGSPCRRRPHERHQSSSTVHLSKGSIQNFTWEPLEVSRSWVTKGILWKLWTFTRSPKEFLSLQFRIILQLTSSLTAVAPTKHLMADLKSRRVKVESNFKWESKNDWKKYALETLKFCSMVEHTRILEKFYPKPTSPSSKCQATSCPRRCDQGGQKPGVWRRRMVWSSRCFAAICLL